MAYDFPSAGRHAQMIISHQHRFVFAAIPKTGTHSVRHALREHMSPDDLEQVGLFVKKRFPFAELAQIAHGHLTLQQVRYNSPPFNAALIAWVEAHRDDDAERNRLCPPNQYAHDDRGYARNLALTWATEGAWLAEPDLTAWVGSSRLNLLGAFAEHQQEPRAVDAVTRYLTHVGEAVGKLAHFARA